MQRASFLLLALYAAGCGVYGKEEPPQGGSGSGDAIAAGSEISWGVPLVFDGALIEDPTRSSAHRFVLTQHYALVLTKDTSMRLIAEQATSSCPGGSSLRGVYFTLSSSDGVYTRTTDEVERSVAPMALEAFPGNVPAGTSTLTVRAYADGPCKVMRTFRFPKPNVDEGSLAPGGSPEMDLSLVGGWSGSRHAAGVPVTSQLTFGADRRVQITVDAEDEPLVEMTGKVDMDRSVRPQRARITVTSVQRTSGDDRASIGDVYRCIYYATPRDEPDDLTWECSPRNDASFPQNFTDKAESFFRVSGDPGGMEDFTVIKDDDVYVAIPDADPTGILHGFDVQTVAGAVLAVGVTFEITHQHVGDLRVSLVHPDGTRVELFARDAGTSTYLARSYGVGGSALPGLADLVGKPLNGKWLLEVKDEVAGDTGALYRAKLVVEARY